jgi:hypothetical protein
MGGGEGSWSYGSWIYNYLCNQCLSPLKLCIRNPFSRCNSIQHYVIRFVSNLRQVGGFLRVLRFHPPIKTDRHDVTEILLNVALSTIKPTQPNPKIRFAYMYKSQYIFFNSQPYVTIQQNYRTKYGMIRQKERWLTTCLQWWGGHIICLVIQS